MSMFTQYFPYKLAPDAGTLEENKKRYAERCIDIMTEYAPNFRKAVIDYQVLAPADLESTFGLTGGNIMQGVMSLSSLWLHAARCRAMPTIERRLKDFIFAAPPHIPAAA